MSAYELSTSKWRRRPLPVSEKSGGSEEGERKEGRKEGSKKEGGRKEGGRKEGGIDEGKRKRGGSGQGGKMKEERRWRKGERRKKKKGVTQEVKDGNMYLSGEGGGEELREEKKNINEICVDS